jgi:GNAT superfamily N-acetyltransferase
MEMQSDRDRRVVRGEDERLLASGLELVSRVLGKDAEKELRHRALDPAYNPRDTFLVVSGGRVVSHLRLEPREMRVGRSLLRVAVFSDVVTAPEQQGRGHARTALDAALESARAERYQLALLFTDLLDFFRDLGWSPWARASFTIDIQPDKAADIPTAVRDYRAADLDSVMAIHGHCGSRYAGPLLRSIAWWKSDLQRRADRGEIVVLEVDGAIKGYARARHSWPDNSEFAITDLASIDHAGEVALLTAFLQRARRQGFSRVTGQIQLSTPLDDLPSGLQVHAERGQDNRAMFKLLSLRRLIRALIPEFQAIRIRQGDCGDRQVDLLVGRMAAEVSARSGNFEVRSPPPNRPSFLQLSEGDFWRLLFQGRLPPTVPGPQAELLNFLFPPREFAFWRADEP